MPLHLIHITSVLTSVNNAISYPYHCQVVFYALHISKTNYRALATLILSSYYIQQICGSIQTQDMLLNNSRIENLDISRILYLNTSLEQFVIASDIT